MKNSLRLVAVAVVASVGLMLVTPTAAHASKKGRRNTALALGAIAAYGLVKKKPAIAGIAGAGAVYSWIQSNKVDDDRDRRRNRNRRISRNRGDRYYDSSYRGDRYYNSGYRQPTYSRYRTSYSPYRSTSYDSSCNTHRGSSSHDRGNHYGHYKSKGHRRK